MSKDFNSSYTAIKSFLNQDKDILKIDCSNVHKVGMQDTKAYQKMLFAHSFGFLGGNK